MIGMGGGTMTFGKFREYGRSSRQLARRRRAALRSRIQTFPFAVLVALVRSLAATGRQVEAWNESRQTIALVADVDDPVRGHVREQFTKLGLWPPQS